LAIHAHTITICFAVILKLCRLILVVTTDNVIITDNVITTDNVIVLITGNIITDNVVMLITYNVIPRVCVVYRPTGTTHLQ